MPALLLAAQPARRAPEAHWESLLKQASGKPRPQADGLITQAWVELKHAGPEQSNFTDHVQRIAGAYESARLWRSRERMVAEAVAMLNDDRGRMQQVQILFSDALELMEGNRAMAVLKALQQARDIVDRLHAATHPIGGWVIGLTLVVDALTGEFELADENFRKLLDVEKIDKPDPGERLPKLGEADFKSLIDAACDILPGVYAATGRTAAMEQILREGIDETSLDGRVLMRRGMLVALLMEVKRKNEAAAEEAKLAELAPGSPYVCDPGGEFLSSRNNNEQEPETTASAAAAPAQSTPDSAKPAAPPAESGRFTVIELVEAAEREIGLKHYPQAAERARSASRELSRLPAEGLPPEEAFLVTGAISPADALARIMAVELKLAAAGARDDSTVDQLASFLISRGDWDLRDVHPSEPLIEYYVAIGAHAKAYRLLDAWKDAIRTQNDEDAPELELVMRQVAAIHRGAGDLRGAIAELSDLETFQESVHGRYTPVLIDTRLLLSEVLFAARDTAKATAAMDGAVALAERWKSAKLEENSPLVFHSFAETLDRAARICLKYGELSRADAYNRLAAAAPDPKNEFEAQMKATAKAIADAREAQTAK